MAGRKSKLTLERIEIIKKNVSLGLTYDLAAKRAGVHPSTFYRWMNGGGSLNRKLREEIEKGNADNAAKHMANITKAAADGSWQASAWVMERRHGYRVGKKHDDVRDVQKKAAAIDLTRVEFIKQEMIDLQLLIKGATKDESWQAAAKLKAQLFELREQLDMAKAEQGEDYDTMNEVEYRKLLAEAIAEWPEEHLALALEEFKTRHSVLLTIEAATG